ncbi:TonB-dependent receptor [Flavobacterium agricola]|uniref:TonB-dependent receptor n=1 Tax=Flavobacterium agricola TaxID=2870839 RepID=A0ABY6M3G4_9FLAO|nr:TonB-dependent receptor [Flavobacterium agricola]UYW01933.1 TonB-dependent receptor [Flavobacterium agricola]
MKNLLKLFFTFLFLISIPAVSQAQKVKITGKVVEKSTNQPLEYASAIAQSIQNPSISDGIITNEKGEFTLNVFPGNYNIKIEFLGFETTEINNRAVVKDINLGTIYVAEDNQLLEEVVISVERPMVEIKLDKKVYNVADDATVKGGTASEVLDNVPSLAVDQDGNVSLRGNDNVTVLIDGRPSGMTGNVADVLRTLPADAISKVEVITNPSARYEAEGGAGIVNIVLKKGKGQGVNGSVSVTAGTPENTRFNGNINVKGEKYNFFAGGGYNKSNSPGNSSTNSAYLDGNGDIAYFMDEKSKTKRRNEGNNVNFGLDLFLTDNITWTNSVMFRNQNGNRSNRVDYNNYDTNGVLNYLRNRDSNTETTRKGVEYNTRLETRFAKDGHKLIIDGAASSSFENDMATILDVTNGTALNKILNERTLSDEKQRRMIGTVDYVLPIGENSQFEAGYRGSYSNMTTDFQVDSLSAGNWVTNTRYTNTFQYIETVNALYSQFGSKINKFSYLVGLRWEDSKINVNELISQNYNTKRYNDFFPSAFLAYELNEKSNVSVSYSRRINRPRGRMLNPFSNYSSNINLFQGNPDLDPSKTNSFDLGYMTKFGKVNFNASAYLNHTENAYQFVSRESGAFVDGVPVILSSPINLATEYRYGAEVNAMYNPFRWWRLNANINVYRSESKGDYTYVNFLGESITQNFDNNTFGASARLTSKVTLPGKIDWQTNISYRAPQDRAQGKVKSETGVNIGFSKDVLKDKATIALNVQDLFNSRKRRFETNLDTVISNSEMQWRERQVNLTFTYRFNRPKNERERFRNNEEMGGGEEMMGM